MASWDAELESPIHGAVNVHGEGNRIVTEPNSQIQCAMTIIGNRNRISIGGQCVIRGGILIQSVDDVEIEIGDRSTLSGVSIQAHETARVSIGLDCMFSTEIMMSVSDMHPIFHADGKRINPAADIVIGDHVWIGFRCVVLKGARIGAGAVIGAGSIVHGDIPAGAVAAGNPARVIRRDVTWRRNLR